MDVTGNDAIDVAVGLLTLLGPTGTVVLLAVAALILRKKLKKLRRSGAKRSVGDGIFARMIKAVLRAYWLAQWAAWLRISLKLAYRLRSDRWNEMCNARGLTGLKRGKVKRTPIGVDVHCTLNGNLTLEKVTSLVSALETGLATQRRAIRIVAGKNANQVVVRIKTRDPLKKPIAWQDPGENSSILVPAPIARTPFGEDIRLNLGQRILIAGSTGAGKSSLQRVLAAFGIRAEDVDMEIWDLKFGTESQHYVGKVDRRITTTAQARLRILELNERELQERADLMTKLGVSDWPTSRKHKARVVIIDEGASLIRDMDQEEIDALASLIERARALGIFFWWATQFPKAENLPSKIRAQFTAIVCMKVEREDIAKVIFESGIREGWTPHRLAGKGWLLVKDEENTEPDVARAVFLDKDDFVAIEPYDTAPVAERPVLPPQPLTVPRVVLTKERDLSGVYTPQIPRQPEERELVAASGGASPAEAVLDVLERDRAKAYTVADLVKETGLGKSTVYNAIGLLKAQNKIVSPQRGSVRATDTEGAQS